MFSGADGLSLGLVEGGFSVIAAADHHVTALETHAHNVGGLTSCGDLKNPDEFISQLKSRRINSVDLVAGSPPCQPFPRAGAPKIADLVRRGDRTPSDERTSLWVSFLKIVEYLKPRAILLEKVPDFARRQHGSTLTALLPDL